MKVGVGSVEPDENGRRFQPPGTGPRSLTASTIEREVNVPKIGEKIEQNQAPSGPPRVDTDQRPSPVEPPKTKPVVVWATLGALLLAFEAWIIIRWVTGPYFVRVEPGPTQPPTWMKVELILWQTLSIPAGLALIYWFIIRPWRREGRVGIDGILVAAFCTVAFQDPLSSYGGHWFAYNTWMFNRGSWVNSVPGWNSYGKPGAMLSEPLLFNPAGYIYGFVLAMVVGSAFMRMMRKRYPRIGNIPLIATCYAVMIVFDIILESIIWMPLGIFHYGGGHWAIFPDHYFKYPINEGLTIGLVYTSVACLRFFVNDRGQSPVERGIDEIRGGQFKKFVIRALAMTAVVQGLMFVGYNVPNFWVGTHSAEWPKDIQDRSYFTSGLCGEGTNRACPGPSVPLDKPGSGHVDTNGQFVPGDIAVPPVVPFTK